MKMKLCCIESTICSQNLLCIVRNKKLSFINCRRIFYGHFKSITSPNHLFIFYVSIYFLYFIMHSNIREWVTMNVGSQVDRTLISSVSAIWKMFAPICSILVIIIGSICITLNASIIYRYKYYFS
jgi:hypothetical protein